MNPPHEFTEPHEWKIPLFRIYWDDQDVTYVTEAISRGMSWAIGPFIEELETMIADYIKRKYCVVFNSGTSALHAQLLAHGIKKGDEIIVPSFTFIATANAPLFVGATPVFADIEEETFGLDPDQVVEKITSKTRAIMPVHYGGCPCKIKELKEITEDYNLLLIEDAAESFGATAYSDTVGTIGDSAMLSFCQNKIITTGDGGAAVTDSKELFEKLKLIRSHGRLETENYFSTVEPLDYIQLGYNLRMSNIVAALGIAQLHKVDKIIEMRRANASYLTEHLETVPDIIPPRAPEGYHHVYQMYTAVCKNRDALKDHLTQKGIMSKVYFYPVHLTHFYKNVLSYQCELPVTERVSRTVLTLPLYPLLTRKEMDFIIKEVRMFYGEIP